VFMEEYSEFFCRIEQLNDNSELAEAEISFLCRTRRFAKENCVYGTSEERVHVMTSFYKNL